MYQVKFNEKMAVVDDYENGEQGQGSSSSFNETVTGETVVETLKKACELVAMETEYFSYDSAMDFEKGNFALNVLEDGEGTQLSNAEIELWKQGKFTAYACSYFGTIYELKTVDLTGAEL